MGFIATNLLVGRGSKVTVCLDHAATVGQLGPQASFGLLRSSFRFGPLAFTYLHSCHTWGRDLTCCFYCTVYTAGSRLLEPQARELCVLVSACMTSLSESLESHVTYYTQQLDPTTGRHRSLFGKGTNDDELFNNFLRAHARYISQYCTFF
jgi:hypothetical protein